MCIKINLTLIVIYTLFKGRPKTKVKPPVFGFAKFIARKFVFGRNWEPLTKILRIFLKSAKN
jgi:hypothetical protein